MIEAEVKSIHKAWEQVGEWIIAAIIFNFGIDIKIIIPVEYVINLFLVINVLYAIYLTSYDHILRSKFNQMLSKHKALESELSESIEYILDREIEYTDFKKFIRDTVELKKAIRILNNRKRI